MNANEKKVFAVPSAHPPIMPCSTWRVRVEFVGGDMLLRCKAVHSLELGWLLISASLSTGINQIKVSEVGAQALSLSYFLLLQLVAGRRTEELLFQ